LIKPQEVIDHLKQLGPCFDSNRWDLCILAGALDGDWAHPGLKEQLNAYYIRQPCPGQLAGYILVEAVYAGWSDDEIKELHSIIPPVNDYVAMFMFALTQELRRDLLKHFGFDLSSAKHDNTEMMAQALLGKTIHFQYGNSHPRFYGLCKKSYVTKTMFDNPAVVQSMFEEIFTHMCRVGWQQLTPWIKNNMDKAANSKMMVQAVKAAVKLGKFKNPNYDDGAMLRWACSNAGWELAEELIKAGAKTNYLSISLFNKLKAALKRRKTDELLSETEITPQHATELLKTFCAKHDSKLYALSKMGDLFKQVTELVELGADLTQVCEPDSYWFKGLMLAAKGKKAAKVEEALVVHAVSTELER
jgi:hypothetical protein